MDLSETQDLIPVLRRFGQFAKYKSLSSTSWPSRTGCGFKIRQCEFDYDCVPPVYDAKCYTGLHLLCSWDAESGPWTMH